MSCTDRVSHLRNPLNNSPKVAQDSPHGLRWNIASSLDLMVLNEPTHSTCKARETFVMVEGFVKSLQVCFREGLTQFLGCANTIWQLTRQVATAHPSEGFIQHYMVDEPTLIERFHIQRGRCRGGGWPSWERFVNRL
jgi:hypothetical protein